MLLFGTPSIVRGTFRLAILVESQNQILKMKLFIRALPRFANFRIMQLKFVGSLPEDYLGYVVDYFKSASEPVLGYANQGTYSLRFRPVLRRNRCREQKNGDWMDSLNGIRLSMSGL